MLQNALELEPHARLDTDVLIIGSGPAGLASALATAARGRDCILLETGEANFSPVHQSLGALDGSFVFGNFQARETDERRQIGGKANAWHVATELGVHGIRLIPYAAAKTGSRSWCAPRQAITSARCACTTIPDRGSPTGSGGCMASPTFSSPAARCFRPAAGRIRP